MLYLGIDMHSKWFTLGGFDKTTGECYRYRKVDNTPEAIAALFDELPEPRCGAMETGTNAVAMHRLLAPYFQQLLLVSPNQVWDRRADTQAKTDPRDAWRLAEALSLGRLHPLFVPTDELRDWRTLGRGRIQATQDITRLTNQLYALVRSWGYVDSKKLLTKTGRAWLETVKLPPHAQQVFTESLNTLTTLQAREAAYEQLLSDLILADPIGQLLVTIPYVGPFTAFILRAELGEITRFASADHLISYSGLVPRVLQTGNYCRFGPLTKHGNAYVRYVAVLFAQNCVNGKQDTPFKRRYYRLRHTHDLNELKVMLARDFLAVVYSIWRSRTPWRDTRPDVAALQASGA